jgi:peptide/nickel transport system ATP-binding protein
MTTIQQPEIVTGKNQRTDLPPILEARDLTKHFFFGNALSRRVLKAVQSASFKLYRGRVTALVGESGSGKSTIVRMLARLHEPTAGELVFDGKPVL